MMSQNLLIIMLNLHYVAIMLYRGMWVIKGLCCMKEKDMHSQLFHIPLSLHIFGVKSESQ